MFCRFNAWRYSLSLPDATSYDKRFYYFPISQNAVNQTLREMCMKHKSYFTIALLTGLIPVYSMFYVSIVINEIGCKRAVPEVEFGIHGIDHVYLTHREKTV